MPATQRDTENDVNGITDGASFTLRANFRVFARAIFTLNRIGDDLYLQPCEEGLIVRSLNCSKSAFSTFLFSTTFFSACDLSRIQNNQANLCRISMKCALSAFKCVKNSEKSVLSCHIFINPRADAMLIELMQTYDVVKSYEIPFYESSSTFRNVINKSELANSFIISSRTLSDLLARLHTINDEILIEAKMDSIILRNYVVKRQGKDVMMKTEAKIPLSQFERYNIAKPANITISLKEFKSLVVFAEGCQTPLSVYFEQAGRPVVISLEGDINFTAELVVSTLDYDAPLTDYSMDYPLLVEHDTVARDLSSSAQAKSIEIVNEWISRVHEQSEQATLERATDNYASVSGIDRYVNRKGLKIATDNDLNQLEMAVEDGVNKLKVVSEIGEFRPTTSSTQNVINESFNEISNVGVVTDANSTNRKKSLLDTYLLPDNSDDDISKNIGGESQPGQRFHSESGDHNSDKSPPSRGSPLLRYLLNVSGSTIIDDEDSVLNAVILAPDSEPE